MKPNLLRAYLKSRGKFKISHCTEVRGKFKKIKDKLFSPVFLDFRTNVDIMIAPL